MRRLCHFRCRILQGFLLVMVVSGMYSACGTKPQSPPLHGLVEKTGLDAPDLAVLPKDTGGTWESHGREEDGMPGYWIYLPAGADKPGAGYPLLVCLHGSGERGDSLRNPADLELLTRNGPPALIRSGDWHPAVPMIVVAPQSPDSQTWWDAGKIQKFTGEIIKRYRVNQHRIYVTGYSLGGFGTFAWLALPDCPVAAAMPICGGGNKDRAAMMARFPVWAFQGTEDRNVSPDISVFTIDAINGQKPDFPARITLYSGISHDSWTMTYNQSGRDWPETQGDPYKQDPWEWMLGWRRTDP